MALAQHFLRIVLVIAMLAALMGVSPAPAGAHGHSGENGQGSCGIAYDHTHGSTWIDGDTVESNPVSQFCTGVKAIIRWTVDQKTYVKTDTDTTCCVYAASASMTGGWDVFHSSDHYGRNGSTWFYFRLWH